MTGMIYLKLKNYFGPSSSSSSCVESDEKLINANNDEHVAMSEKVLWDMHEQLLLTYKRFALAHNDGMSHWSIEEDSQLNYYFSYLRTTEHGRRLVIQILTCFPSCHHHSIAKSSKPHIKIIKSIMNRLNKNKEECDVSKDKGYDEMYRVENEFIGENDLPPIDSAVYKNNKLIAFIEVDGEHHYDDNNNLRREDHLKEYLYNHYYRTIPILRYRLKNNNNDEMNDILHKILNLK